nr:2-amino-4-hydroxy-6-hydroxymethyldihydropteridine diphosphokinase [Lysobacter sp. M15]
MVIGSNRRRAANMRHARRRLQEHFEVLDCARARRTRDGDGARYLNAAVRVRSTLPPSALRTILHAIEDETGRTRGDAAVTLDIDLVASRDAQGRVQTHKPDDLQRDYVRELLAQIGFDPM